MAKKKQPTRNDPAQGQSTAAAGPIRDMPSAGIIGDGSRAGGPNPVGQSTVPNIAGAIQGKDPLDPGILMSEIGVSGLRQSYGILIEEFLPQLIGQKGVKVFREMRDNDAGIGAVMFAITNMLRAAKWAAEPSDKSAEAEKEAEFAQSLLDDMSHTFEDFIAEALSMLDFGWAYHEIVFKNRVGPEENDPTKKSKYDDGRIGVRKLALRSQDTLWRWEMQADGGIAGMWQYPPLPTPGKPTMIFIPIERALLFRTTSRKNSPEGVSILRNAYRSWWYSTRLEEIEAIGVERDLAGLPVIRIPSRYFKPTASDAEKAILNDYRAIARDMKRNEQGGVVIPSDPWFDGDGKPLPGQFQVMIELLTSGGERTISTDPIITRHQTNIARSVLADFIMLGNAGRGSYALSKNKTDLFLKACETFLNMIAAVLNRYLLPRVWQVNGLDPDVMPTFKPGRIAPVDLAELGAFLRDYSAAGGELFPDETLENYVRDMADLPEKSPEAAAAQQAFAAQLQDARLAAAGGAQPGKPGAQPPRKGQGQQDPNVEPPPADDPGTFLADGSGQGGSVGKITVGRDGVLKFSPDQPRDDHGMWAAVAGAGAGATFASPSLQEGMDFGAARQALSGARQAAFRGATAMVDHEMGLRSQTTDVIGAWHDGAENSILGTVHGATWDQLVASAAMKGWLGNQKQVLVFQHGAGDGDSYLASFHVGGGQDLASIHQGLLDSGLDFHTLAPTGNGATIYLFGKDQKSLDAAASFAGKHGAQLNVRFGHGEYIGTSATGGSDAWQRSDARKQYEAAIAASAQRDGGQAARAWDRIHARYGQSLDAIKASFLSKAFDEDQHPRDDHGRFTEALGGEPPGFGLTSRGGPADAVLRVPKKTAAWLAVPENRKFMLKTAAVAATTAAIEIPEHAVLHETVNFICEHLSTSGAIASSSVAVGVKHVAKYLGITSETAKEWVISTIQQVRDAAVGERLLKAAAALGKIEMDKETYDYLGKYLEALKAYDPSKDDGSSATAKYVETTFSEAIKSAAEAAAAHGVPVFVIAKPGQ